MLATVGLRDTPVTAPHSAGVSEWPHLPGCGLGSLVFWAGTGSL